jgi:tetratricopeptide (TPR) repeat protein
MIWETAGVYDVIQYMIKFRIKVLSRGLGIVALILTLGGCAGSGHKTAAPDDSARDVRGEGYQHFVNADLLEMNGLYPQALQEYENALRFYPKSVTIRTDYARLLFRQQRSAEALQQALAVEPKSSEICLLIGDCYRLTDSLAPAISYYRKAVLLDSANINAYWYLAGIYRQQGKDDSAIAAYFHLAHLSDTYMIWHELGALLGKNKRYVEAIDAFKKAIELNADKANMNAYLGLAAAYDAIDSVSWAEQTFAHAIALDGYDVRIYRQMLSMYLARQDIKKSITAAEKLVAITPSDWVAQRRLGILLYSDNQLNRADSLFHSRVDFGDENVLNYFYLGRIAMEQNRYDDAGDMFTKVTQKDSAFADGWLNLGYAYRQQDSMVQAISVFKQGLTLCKDPEDRKRLMFALGSAQERHGLFEDAVNTFQELISLDPKHGPALNYLGYMLADKGIQLNYALELLERAVAISPDNGAFLDSYAWVQYKLGKLDLALSELKKAVGLMGNDATIYEHLGDVYKAMGNASEAESNYRRSLEINPDNPAVEEKLK